MVKPPLNLQSFNYFLNSLCNNCRLVFCYNNSMSQFGRMPTQLNLRNRPREIDWRVRREFLPLFDEGKDLEIRVCNGFPKRVREGDILKMPGRKRKVLKIWRYKDFDELLNNQESRRIHPHKDRDGVLQLLRASYTKVQEDLGGLAFKLVPVEDSQSHGRGGNRNERRKVQIANPTPAGFVNNLGDAMKRALEQGEKK